MGVSKAIPRVPTNIEIGNTWVLIAYNNVPDLNDSQYRTNYKDWLEQKECGGLVKNANSPANKPPSPPKKTAIIYAFLPTRVEMPTWEKDATEKHLKDLRKQGITPVIWDDEDLTNKMSHEHDLTMDDIRFDLDNYGHPGIPGTKLKLLDKGDE
jgi:hypothetical protein